MTLAMVIRPIPHLLTITLLIAGPSACAPQPSLIPTSSPTSVESTATYEALRNIPAPKQPVPVAVYSYPDLTGQFKPTETVSTNSRAVTQGAVWMLMKSLKDAGGGRWFKVIQRANLDNLLKERQIIRETRSRIEKQTGRSQPKLPSLLFAGVILEGGIVGYDSNTVTGGLGARYLGIGGDVQYRQDTVTIYLNAISSQNGEILKSVMTRKTVVSYGVHGSVFKFVAFQKLLEAETGYTVNEPGQIAIAQAIEHAVRALIIEGALENLWQFEDEVAGKLETQIYLADKKDDLLLGTSIGGTAQALLTDEQLAELAVAQRDRRNGLKAQARAEIIHDNENQGDVKYRITKKSTPIDEPNSPVHKQVLSRISLSSGIQKETLDAQRPIKRSVIDVLDRILADFKKETKQKVRRNEAKLTRNPTAMTGVRGGGRQQPVFHPVVKAGGDRQTCQDVDWQSVETSRSLKCADEQTSQERAIESVRPLG